MATLQSPGIGSGLDISSLVTQLVAAERAPKQQQITKQLSAVAVQISAVGSLKGALSGFQLALAPLKNVSSFNVFSARSGDSEVFTASASSSAPAGAYDVEVVNLATAQQLSSNAFASSTSIIGTGSLTVSVGDKSFTIEAPQGGATLESIRNSINQAAGNTAVRATIVQATDGAHLVLTASATGAANEIRVTTAGGDGGLGALTYASPQETNNYTEVRPAQDALIRIAGSERTSASNVVKDVVDGVTLTLHKADPDNPVSLVVDRNLDAVTTRINAFVSQFNSLATTISGLQSYDAVTQKAGPLLGDALLRGIDSGLRRALSAPVEGASGAYTTLSSLGIAITVEGKLEVDAGKLRAALEADFDGVARVFGAENGVATRIDKLIAPHLSVDGSIAQRNSSLDQRSRTLGKDQVALDERMAVLQERYLRQFTALDTLLSQLQSTSSYLALQLENLPKRKE